MLFCVVARQLGLDSQVNCYFYREIDHFCPTSVTYREQVSTNQHGQFLNGQLTVSYYDQFFPSRNKFHALVFIEGMPHTRMSN